MSDSTEIYYAEMEAARNESEQAYFEARPQLFATIADRTIFKAGFERGFQKLWNQRNNDWQPIETAPKDGKSILVVNGNWIVTAHWHRSQQCWASCGPTYERLPWDEQPTHWMPLPEPPK